MNQITDSKIINEIFNRFAKQNPNPTTELIYKNPFELLIAVILSAQATDKSVNKATEQLFAVANTAEKMINLGEKNLKNYIKNIGLFNTKAKNIIKTCHDLIKHHQGIVPNNRTDLEKLAGVGRKTANVMLNTAFGQNTLAVDTHVFRVANRTGLAISKNVLQTEKILLSVIPQKYLYNAHHWLILFGRYTCTAKKPKCNKCLINDICNNPIKINYK